MASNDRRSMGLRRLAKMLFTYRMPGFLSESRQPESTRLVPMWPGMRLRLIDSFPGQPCPLRGRAGVGGDAARTAQLLRRLEELHEFALTAFDGEERGALQRDAVGLEHHVAAIDAR